MDGRRRASRNNRSQSDPGDVPIGRRGETRWPCESDPAIAHRGHHAPRKRRTATRRVDESHRHERDGPRRSFGDPAVADRRGDHRIDRPRRSHEVEGGRMKPTRLLLTAFRGIKDGLGLDTYELDLEAFGDARLVAIAGPNGKGKSTVLDNLHPYPILPSRATSYSPGAFSMYDHVLAPEAVKELDWEHQGKKYRSSLLWRNSGKRKSCEAYLFEADQDLEWKPARLPDGTVSDGTIEIDDPMLIRNLGTAEMFFLSQV